MCTLLFRFLGSDDIENFFSRAQRSRIVYEILSTTAFGREKKGEVSIPVKPVKITKHDNYDNFR